jgi:DNA-directed RNA polymerase alpha subunit
MTSSAQGANDRSWRTIAVEEIRLPTRAVNVLRVAGMLTAGDIADTSEMVIRRLPNLGVKSWQEVRAALTRLSGNKLAYFK